MEGGLTPERVSMEASQGRQGWWLSQDVGSFIVPTTPPVQGAWDKRVGPRIPGPLEQEWWACGLRRDRDSQDLAGVYQEHSDDRHVGLGTRKVREHS